MKIDPNDPRLTAYALGELDDAERAEIEALLKDDEPARREVETIRRATTIVTDELQSEPCPRLHPKQVAAIAERSGPRVRETRAFPWWQILGWTTALGTAVIVAALMFPARNSARHKAPSPNGQQVKLEPQPSAPGSFYNNNYATPAADQSVTVTVPPADSRQAESQALQLQPPAASVRALSAGGTAPTHEQLPRSGSAQFDDGKLAWNSAQSGVSGQLAQNGADASVASRYGRTEQLSDIPMRRKGRVDWWSDRQPAGSLTFYRGDQVQLVPLDEFNTESYTHSVENGFVSVSQSPLSTFSLDVDTASYANIRRFLNQGTLPPRDAVRIEEMLNYFPYDYPAPRRGDPFSLYVEMAECPWNAAHRLALVALKAKDVAPYKVQPMNLVFLIDVSGSMADANKLPLVKQSLRLLVEQLTARDHVAIVVYAGDSHVALPSTSGDDKETILQVIDSLEAGGSTNGGAGIQTAYREAASHFIEGGVNRVILCTDGDFNVGVTNQNDLIRMIQQQAQSHVFLTILGVGMGNLKDSTMQKLADKGNGNYAYIDTLDEANKVLVEQMRGTLVTVAKDAKMQIEFNPALVQAYRLIGYEKRRLRAQDFNNDRKDAGEVGAGHTVTALYEIVPALTPAAPGVDPLTYQVTPRATYSDELMAVKLRYKEPEGSTSKLLTAPIKDQRTSWRGTSSDFRFAASIAAFGLILRDSPYKGSANFDLVLQLAEGARGHDANGYRGEFISLVNQARTTNGTPAPDDP